MVGSGPFNLLVVHVYVDVEGMNFLPQGLDPGVSSKDTPNREVITQWVVGDS